MNKNTNAIPLIGFRVIDIIQKCLLGNFVVSMMAPESRRAGPAGPAPNLFE